MLFFDLDGTLTDTNGLWLEVDTVFLTRRGLEITDEYRKYIVHCIFNTAAEYARRVYGLDDSEEAIKAEWLALAYEHYSEKAELKPGVREYLDGCATRGARLAIITSCMPELCESALKRHGLLDRFEFIVYANDLGVEKRRPDAYLHAVRLAGVPPESCVMFEDSPVSAAGAKQAGLFVVGLRDSFFESRADEMRGICDEYYNSFIELPAYSKYEI